MSCSLLCCRNSTDMGTSTWQQSKARERQGGDRQAGGANRGSKAFTAQWARQGWGAFQSGQCKNQPSVQTQPCKPLPEAAAACQPSSGAHTPAWMPLLPAPLACLQDALPHLRSSPSAGCWGHAVPAALPGCLGIGRACSGLPLPALRGALPQRAAGRKAAERARGRVQAGATREGFCMAAVALSPPPLPLLLPVLSRLLSRNQEWPAAPACAPTAALDLAEAAGAVGTQRTRTPSHAHALTRRRGAAAGTARAAVPPPRHGLLQRWAVAARPALQPEGQARQVAGLAGQWWERRWQCLVRSIGCCCTLLRW